MDSEKIETWIELLRDNDLLHSKQIKLLQAEMKKLKELLESTNQKELEG